MLGLMGAINVEDAFRAIHDDRLEFTHSETSHGRARRLDRILVSSATRRIGALPAVTAAQHVAHDAPVLARRFNK